MCKKHILWLISGLWIIIIIILIGSKQFTLLSGTKILLKTLPVDPRDILRGDYIILNYEISRLSLDDIPFSSTLKLSSGERIYLILKKEGKYWCASEIRKDRPQNDLIFIKGKINYITGRDIIVNYGIESYFVPEGKGRELEEYRGKELDVEVTVNSYGHAIINKLYLNGTEVKFK